MALVARSDTIGAVGRPTSTRWPMSRTSSTLWDRMIFVVGARRSGTNWLQRVLTAHPDVVGVPSETYLFSHGLPPLVERFQHGALSSARTGFVYMDRDALYDALRDLCDRAFSGIREGLRPEADRICERTPDHVRTLELMGEIYPDGRFLHIVRDGRDVTRSLLSQPWGPTSVEEAAAEWRSAIEAARASCTRLDHYREVRYEQLLSDPRPAVADLYGWLGLPASEEIVEGALLESGIRYNVDRRAPDIASGKWEEAFSRDELARLLAVAAPTLRELAYETSRELPEEKRDARKESRGRSLLRRTLSRQPAPDVADRVEATQATFHRFLEAIVARRPEEIEGLLEPTAFVRLVGPELDAHGRGEPMIRRLVETLMGDEAFAGRQLRGDVHPGLPTFTLVATYERDDGTHQHRVLVVTAEGSRVGRVAYYAFPGKKR